MLTKETISLPLLLTKRNRGITIDLRNFEIYLLCDFRNQEYDFKRRPDKKTEFRSVDK